MISRRRRETSCQACPVHLIKESSTHHAAEQTAGHVPDSLAEILYQPLVDGNITINSKITGQSRSAPESKALGSKEEDWRFLACMKFS